MAARRRGEARDAIIASARLAFARDGYESTNLREIATTANVSMTLIYRYFGSKGGLFEETLIAPARAFVDDLLARWKSAGDPPDRSVLISDFVRTLYGFVAEHRGLFAAWADADRHEQSEVLSDGSHGQAMRRIAEALGVHAGDEAELDEAQMVVACAGGLVLSFALLEGVLLPAGRLRDPEVQLTAITRAACAIAGVRLLEGD